MLSWAGAPLPPNGTLLPPVLQGHGLGMMRQAEGKGILVTRL